MATLFVPGYPPSLVGNIWVNVKDSKYGAKGDGQVVNDVSATAASPTINSASGKFKSADTGKSAAVWDPVNRRIVANNCTMTYVSATQATLSVNAAFSGTNLTMIWGSDDTAAIQAAHDAVYNAGGGGVVTPEGMFTCSHNNNISVNGSNQGYCLRVRSNVRWLGAGMGATQLCTLNDASNLLICWADSDVSVENITLRATGTQGDPFKFFAASRFVADKVHAVDGGYGFQVIGCTDADLTNVHGDGQYDTPTYGGGYTISIGDNNTAALTGTSRIRVRGATGKNSQYGAVRVYGDVTATTFPVGVKVSEVDAYQCGPTTGGRAAFWVYAVTETDLVLCRAEQCDIGYSFEGVGIAGTATAHMCRAIKCYEHGFRGYGFVGGVLTDCFAFDNNVSNDGGCGVVLMDDGSARGSTGWRIRGVRAGNRTVSDLQAFGYSCTSTNSGNNLLDGNDWTTAAGGTSQYKANDTHINNIPA